MNWKEYFAEFDRVLHNANPEPPYDDEHFVQYSWMNHARFTRWMKKDYIQPETAGILKNITDPQRWILITEPWCGDAAHIVPVVIQMSAKNELIDLDIQLRDSGSEIDSYLTNGTKSIPILIVRDENGKDLFQWGPRPQKASDLFTELRAAGKDLEDIKLELQNFYNKDKTISTQEEIAGLIQSKSILTVEKVL